MRRFLIAGLAGSSILLAWRFQQDSPQRAAEQVLGQVIDAHNRMQWARIVTLLHLSISTESTIAVYETSKVHLY